MAERWDLSKNDALIERIGPDEAEGKLAEQLEDDRNQPIRRMPGEAANDAGG